MSLVIIGCGGHARVVYEILHATGHNVTGFTDDHEPDPAERIMGLPIVGRHNPLPGDAQDQWKQAIIAIGDNTTRKLRFQQVLDAGLVPVTAIHPTAILSPTARIGEGSVICPGAQIHTEAMVGVNSIINSGAIVEHEVQVGDHAHIAPRAVIAGRSRIGEGAFIGAGSVIKECVTIGDGAIIGAGSVVLSDVKPDHMVAGSPARLKRAP